MRAASSSALAVVPYAAITAVGMLAVDLALPALPAMRAELDAPLALSQATMSVFLLGLAASQLPWGWACDRHGPERALAVGMGAFLLASLACGLAPSIRALLIARCAQGIAAGVTTVAVPVLVTRDLGSGDAVRALAWVGMAESIVPAIGPLVGAALVTFGSFRTAYFVLASLAFVASVTLASRRSTVHANPDATRTTAPDADPEPFTRAFRRLCASHALALGTLLAFVSTAPELLAVRFASGPGTFAMLQIGGVAAFAACAARTSGVASRIGARRTARLGSIAQGISAAIIGVALAVGPAATPVLMVGGAGLSAGLGVRGPIGFASAMRAAGARPGAAAAWIMLSCQAVAAAVTQCSASLLETWPLGIAAMMIVACAASFVLLPREV